MRRISSPAPWTDPLPAAAPPAEMALYQLPTGTYETRAILAVKGGSFRERRSFAATAVLVQHPDGDLLIDAGFGSEVADHVAMLPRVARAPYRLGSTVAQQFEAAAYDRDRLRGVVVTHAHWDHVGGLADLPVPIWINAEEMRYAAEDPDGAVYRRVSRGHEVHQYQLDGPAYLGFSSSHDVYGDGSVVIALAGGHTAGSVVVFVALPSGRRYAFIGDLTWQLDGIRRRVERPWLLQKLADVDPARVREGLGHVIALEDQMQIVPAHDLDAYAGIPLLGGASPGRTKLA